MSAAFVQRVLFVTGTVLLTLVSVYALLEAPDVFLLTVAPLLFAVFLRTVAVTVLLAAGSLAGFSWFVGPRLYT